MFCNNCGTQNPDGASFCNKCGSKFTPPVIESTSDQPKSTNLKNQIIAVVLAFFLGGFGAHKFYLHEKGASWYLILSWTLIPTLLGWVDAFRIGFMSKDRFYEKYNAQCDAYSKKTGPANISLNILVILCCIGFIALLIRILSVISGPSLINGPQNNAQIRITPTLNPALKQKEIYKITEDLDEVLGLRFSRVPSISEDSSNVLISYQSSVKKGYIVIYIREMEVNEKHTETQSYINTFLESYAQEYIENTSALPLFTYFSSLVSDMHIYYSSKLIPEELSKYDNFVFLSFTAGNRSYGIGKMDYYEPEITTYEIAQLAESLFSSEITFSYSSMKFFPTPSADILNALTGNYLSDIASAQILNWKNDCESMTNAQLAKYKPMESLDGTEVTWAAEIMDVRSSDEDPGFLESLIIIDGLIWDFLLDTNFYESDEDQSPVYWVELRLPYDGTMLKLVGLPEDIALNLKEGNFLQFNAKVLKEGANNNHCEIGYLQYIDKP